MTETSIVSSALPFSIMCTLWRNTFCATWSCTWYRTAIINANDHREKNRSWRRKSIVISSFRQYPIGTTSMSLRKMYTMTSDCKVWRVRERNKYKYFRRFSSRYRKWQEIPLRLHTHRRNQSSPSIVMVFFSIIVLLLHKSTRKHSANN